jgi:hypothetical protein
MARMARVLEGDPVKNILAAFVLVCSLSACESEEAMPEAAELEQSERNYCWYQYLECLHWAGSAEDEYWCDVAYADCMGY